jgi:hypothetical protein
MGWPLTKSVLNLIWISEEAGITTSLGPSADLDEHLESPLSELASLTIFPSDAVLGLPSTV